MTTKSWVDIPGETPDQDIEFLLSQMDALPDNAVIVELGALVGRTTIALAQACRGTKRVVYAVDNFREDHTERGGWITPSRVDLEMNLDEARVKSRVRVLEGDTVGIGKNWSYAQNLPVDFLFIDADHWAVEADLDAWLPNMKKGGIICLHDFNNSHTPDVEKAARAILGEPQETHWLTAMYRVGD